MLKSMTVKDELIQFLFSHISYLSFPVSGLVLHLLAVSHHSRQVRGVHRYLIQRSQRETRGQVQHQPQDRDEE